MNRSENTKYAVILILKVIKGRHEVEFDCT